MVTTTTETVQKALEDDTVLKVLCLTTGLSPREVVEALDELHADSAPPMGEEGDIFVELDYQLYFKIHKPFGLTELDNLLRATTEALEDIDAGAPEGVYTPARVRYTGYAVARNEGDQRAKD